MFELTIKISLDGDSWCALVGDNLQEGRAGFGSNPNDALLDLVQEAIYEEVNLDDYAV